MERGSLSIEELAVLFTDVAGSTEYFRRYGDEKGRKMLKKHLDLSSPYIYAFGGRVVKTVGDSIIAYFKDPRDALLSAISIQEKLKRFRQPKGEEERIHVRIGIHYGRTIVEENDIFGDVVNVTSKLTEISEVDGILVSYDLLKRVNGIPNVFFVELQKSEKKGIVPEEIQVYRVIWQEGVEFEPKKRTGIFVNVLLPLSAKRAKEILMNSYGKDISPFEEINVREESLILIVPKKGVQLHDCLEKIGYSFLLEGPLPPKIVIDLFLPGDPLTCEEGEMPWRKIVPGEAFISSCALEFTEGEFALEEDVVLSGREGISYVKVRWCPEQKNLISEEGLPLFYLSGGEKPCFYCGDRRHKMSECPSKELLDLDQKVDEIGYYPEDQLIRSFFNYLILGSERNEGLPRMIHLAFFEPKKIFQLRFLNFLVSRKSREWEDLTGVKDPDQKGGLLRIAIDSIRLSDYKKAQEFIKRAEEEIEDQFAIFCVKGFYYLEIENDEHAKKSFEMALKYARTKAEKTYVLFLLWRLSFISNNFKETERLIRDIIDLDYSPTLVRYFYSIFKLHSSQLFPKERERHIKSLVKLIGMRKEYYIYVIFDVELAPFFPYILKELKELNLIAKREAESFISEASNLYFSSEPLLLKEEMEELSSGIDSAKKMMERGGYFAFLDSINTAKLVMEKVRLIAERRAEEKKEAVEAIKQKLDWIKSYVDRYPYQFFLKEVKVRLKNVVDRFFSLEKIGSFSLWAEKKKEIENEIQFLERRLKNAEDFRVIVGLSWTFLKVFGGCLILLYVIDFFILHFFSSSLERIFRRDFFELKRAFFYLGFVFSLIFSFYLTVRRGVRWKWVSF